MFVGQILRVKPFEPVTPINHMTSTFDKRRAGTYFFILALAVLFAVQWGPGSVGCDPTARTQAKTDVAATVNGKEIPLSDFAREYSNQMQRFRSQGLTNELAKQLGLHRQVVDTLVNRELLAQAAEARGLGASDAELLAEIKKMPDFHDKNGNFDPETYRDVVRGYLRRTPVEFEDMIRRQIAAGRLLDLVEAAAVVSDDEVRAKFQKEGNTAKVTFVRFSPSSYAAKVPAAKPGQVDAWAKANEAAIATYYEQNKLSYFQPEQVKLRQILIRALKDEPQAKRDEAKTKIENLKKELETGKDFATLATQFSDDTETKEKGGDLGWVERISLPPALADAAFTLKEGELTAPVETPLGWHLAKVEGKKAPETKTLDQVRPEIAALLYTRDQAKALAKADADKALAQVKAGKKLVELYPPDEGASENAFAAPTSQKPHAVDTGDFNAGAGQVPQLGVHPALVKAIFEREAPGLLDQTFDVGDGVAVVVVEGRAKPSDERWASEKERLTTEAVKAKQFELRESFVKGLKQAGAVVVNDRELDRVLEG